MPRSFFALPDGTKVSIYKPEVGSDPDNPEETNLGIQEYLRADIASYLVVADNVAVANNTNLLSIFNNTGKRIRIQRISVYPRNSADNNIVLQVGYINNAPTGGTDAVISKLAADYPPGVGVNLNTLIPSKVLPTTPNPTAGIILGGTAISLNSDFKKYNLYEVIGNGSALILRSSQDGITIRDVGQTSTGGNITIEVLLTYG